MSRCRLCLEALNLSDDVVITEKDKKIYQNIFECCKEQLEGRPELTEDLAWNLYPENSKTPFCEKCFKSSEKLYRVAKELEELKSSLEQVIKVFACEIHLRLSHNGPIVKEEEERLQNEDLALKEDIDIVYIDNDNGETYFEEEIGADEEEVEIFGNIAVSEDEESSLEAQDPFAESVSENKINDTVECDSETIEIPGKRNSPLGVSKHYRRILPKPSNSANLKDVCSSGYPRVILERLDDKKIIRKPGIGEKKNTCCPICSKTFTTAKSCRRHLRTHSVPKVDRYPFKCDLCSKGCKTELSLRAHERLVHNLRKKSHCKICKKAFNFPNRLKQHVETVHEKKRKYFCPTCGMGFTQSQNVTRHEKCHKNESERKNFSCSICEKSFSKKVSLQNHEETHKEGYVRKKFKCEICGDKYFNYKENLHQHQSLNHLVFTEGILDCHMCGNQFADGLQLIRHRETRSESFKCPCCKEYLRTRCQMLIHYGEKHPDEELPFQCPGCSCTFVSAMNLNEHLTSYSKCGKNTESEKHVCTNCGKTFANVNSLNCHFFNVERKLGKFYPCRSSVTGDTKTNTIKTTIGPEEQKLFHCSFCGREFPSKNTVIIHQRQHTGERPYKCSTCGKAFSSRNNLRSHKAIHSQNNQTCCHICGKSMSHSRIKTHIKGHTEEKQFTCSFCGEIFACRSFLKSHEKIHEQDSKACCHICGKSISKGNIKTHIKSHTEKKVFTCSLCGRTFSLFSNLKRHEMGTHKGEKPYKCKFCEKAFVQNEQKKTHERTHSGEKPYSCEVCGKAYGDRSSWVKHRKTHN